MGIVEDFGRDLEWRAAWRRVQEREPEICEAFADLAEEVGLRQANGPRQEAEAVTRALAVEGGRQAVAAFRDALAVAQTEIGEELRGGPLVGRRPPLHLEEPEVEDHPPVVEPWRRPEPPPKEDRGAKPKPSPPPPPPPIESGPPPFSPLRRSSGWTSL